ncbi:hypothetical protein GLOTRDRAFT_141029 [Gloeophyllum trabeum ATCC 11539]|uniref:Uncharacterized protein n=1 Tax=Gloeophyllum trabeum (strain ATCC 11539 / FP-39264 / Madison 617) TaxID=670483 RepID=S7PTQ8_GLOTA|nr:uncharacterized protein GLOTRDRAFT_141029 [Gloeophyllum trabeum ATCC 11539]EPQ51176.1 hypothetical protein GLOTRDRAFT_141029 [Gloeophyllum trabeum ATCC 11539]
MAFNTARGTATPAPGPLRLLRLLSLFLAFAWGVISFALGIHALIESRHDKDTIKHGVPAGTVVNIDTTDILGAGGAATAASGLLFVLSLLFLISSFVPLPLLGSLPLQAHLLAFTTVFLFATAVPTSYYFANGHAKVTASLFGYPLDQSVIQATERQLGVTSIYRHIFYLRLIAIIPWIAFLFSLTSTILSYLAARRARAAAAGATPIADEKNRPVMNEAGAV